MTISANFALEAPRVIRQNVTLAQKTRAKNRVNCTQNGAISLLFLVLFNEINNLTVNQSVSDLDHVR
jgi:hypothetical protein